MSSSPPVFSSDSEGQNDSGGLDYASRADHGAGFPSGLDISPSLGSMDYGRRYQASGNGLSLRPQDTGALFSSAHMVCLRSSSGVDLDLSKNLGQPQPGAFYSTPTYDPTSQYFRDECARLRHEKEQLFALVHMLR
jgi:hypothetical protein